MPRLTNVKSRDDKDVMWIVGFDDDPDFPVLGVYPEENPDSRVITGPITKVKYNKDGSIKELEDSQTIFKIKPRPRGRPRRQDF
jgi:hypothetical protein